MPRGGKLKKFVPNDVRENICKNPYGVEFEQKLKCYFLNEILFGNFLFVSGKSFYNPVAF